MDKAYKEGNYCATMEKYLQVTRHDTPHGREGYRLPFQGDVHLIQGYNGPFSHRAFGSAQTTNEGAVQDDRFSLDFSLPLESLVLAAKAGKAHSVTDNRQEVYRGTDFEGGIEAIPNVIYLRHADGSFTLYSHLAAGSALVHRGETVQQGQPIARTGLSGWIGPQEHLHFAALTMSGYFVRRTFPVTFTDYEGPLEHDELTFFAGRRKMMPNCVNAFISAQE